MFKKIVIAEDDDAIAHMVSMALGDAGFLCLRAYDGDEALRLVRAHDPDLLVLDWMMPRVDGLEVARRLKSDVMWSRTPILMLTALATVEHQVEGLEAGADAYMTKPFDLREFAARAKALIRSTQRERDRNPTTDLPGSRAIEGHLAELLKSGAPVAVLHVDLLQFDGYADAVGFAKAEDAVRALAKVILTEARAHGDGAAFVGHLGGSDFIAVTAPERGEALAAALVAHLRAGKATLFPGDATRLAPVIAVATTAELPAGGADQLARRLGAAMRTAKQADDGGYVIWRG
ncbi:MAG: response regulator [Kofleriaceae bacterium]|nr:response regulator [Kofleriaceae bacterium]MBP9168383.1 response regulator [Kofleriaceae bacterium]MBP9861380.1 response regulator [Kofleriaceae bacterium]